jgi:hypothetical protein
VTENAQQLYNACAHFTANADIDPNNPIVQHRNRLLQTYQALIAQTNQKAQDANATRLVFTVEPFLDILTVNQYGTHPVTHTITIDSLELQHHPLPADPTARQQEISRIAYQLARETRQALAAFSAEPYLGGLELGCYNLFTGPQKAHVYRALVHGNAVGPLTRTTPGKAPGVAAHFFFQYNKAWDHCRSALVN